MTDRRPLPDSDERRVRRLNARLARVAVWFVTFLAVSIVVLLLWRLIAGP